MGLGALFVLAAALATLWFAGPRAQTAEAAPCTVTPYNSYGAGILVLGQSNCGASDPLATETYAVFCHLDGITHHFFVFEDITGPYPANEVPYGPCDEVSGIVVNGLQGPDVIDLSRVSASNGFTGIAGANSISLDGGNGTDRMIGSGFSDVVAGGADSDVIQVRDGKSDSVDCGDGFDSVQTDQLGVDALSNCESVDALPSPLPTPPTAAPPTAQPLKKCKKKRRSAAAAKKKRCKKKRR